MDFFILLTGVNDDHISTNGQKRNDDTSGTGDSRADNASGDTAGTDAADVRQISWGQRHEADPCPEIVSCWRRRDAYSAIDELNVVPLGKKHGFSTEAAARQQEIQEVHRVLRVVCDD